MKCAIIAVLLGLTSCYKQTLKQDRSACEPITEITQAQFNGIVSYPYYFNFIALYTDCIYIDADFQRRCPRYTTTTMSNYQLDQYDLTGIDPIVEIKVSMTHNHPAFCLGRNFNYSQDIDVTQIRSELQFLGYDSCYIHLNSIGGVTPDTTLVFVF